MTHKGKEKASKGFTYSVIQADSSATISDEQLARKIYEEEMEQIRKEREREEELSMALVKQLSQVQQSPQRTAPVTGAHNALGTGAKCDKCNLFFPFNHVHFFDNCIHVFCTGCAKDYILSDQNSNCYVESINCLLNESCQSTISTSNIKNIIGGEQYEKLQERSFKLLCKSDQNGGRTVFFNCPSCSVMIEGVNSTDEQIVHQLEQQKQNVNEVTVHKQKCRFRCAICSTEFCSQCEMIPYHEGFTCEQYKIYKVSKKCRFCGEKIEESNSSTSDGGDSASVCQNSDCIVKKELICKKQHQCGHLCHGLDKEEKCLPCLDEGCAINLNQTGEDFCNICFVECLNQGPCIKLECGHIFHYQCVQKKIQKKWPGARITFGFMNCPLCQAIIEHDSVKSELEPLLKLKSEVEEKSLIRLKFENMEQHDDIVNPESRFHNNKLAFALNNFAYYPCYQCKKPYFGGMRRCDQNAGDGNQSFNEKELICGSCCAKKSSSTGILKCDKHGTEFIEYKCKFCCSLATWFCWGNTHFCDECHKKQCTTQKLTKLSASQLPKCLGVGKCPIGGHHPPHPCELALGCSLCHRQPHDF